MSSAFQSLSAGDGNCSRITLGSRARTLSFIAAPMELTVAPRHRSTKMIRPQPESPFTHSPISVGVPGSGRPRRCASTAYMAIVSLPGWSGRRDAEHSLPALEPGHGSESEVPLSSRRQEVVVLQFGVARRLHHPILQPGQRRHQRHPALRCVAVFGTTGFDGGDGARPTT